MLSRPKKFESRAKSKKKATDFLVVLLEDIGEEERITVLYVCTCLHRGCNHRDNSDEDGADDVDDREDQIDL